MIAYRVKLIRGLGQCCIIYAMLKQENRDQCLDLFEAVLSFSYLARWKTLSGQGWPPPSIQVAPIFFYCA